MTLRIKHQILKCIALNFIAFIDCFADQCASKNNYRSIYRKCITTNATLWFYTFSHSHTITVSQLMVGTSTACIIQTVNFVIMRVVLISTRRLYFIRARAYSGPTFLSKWIHMNDLTAYLQTGRCLLGFWHYENTPIQIYWKFYL